MGASRVEETEAEHARLRAGATSTDSWATWTWATLCAVALGVSRLLLSGTIAWVTSSVLGFACIALVLHGLSLWRRTVWLRRRLGELVLTVRPHPARVGEPLEVHLAQRVRARVTMQATTVRLLCSAARVETFGAYDRKQRVWSVVFEAEVLAIRHATFDAGEEIRSRGEIPIPTDQFGSSDWTRWWIDVEASVEAGPRWSASYPLEVVRSDASGTASTE